MDFILEKVKDLAPANCSLLTCVHPKSPYKSIAKHPALPKMHSSALKATIGLFISNDKHIVVDFTKFVI